MVAVISAKVRINEKKNVTQKLFNWVIVNAPHHGRGARKIFHIRISQMLISVFCGIYLCVGENVKTYTLFFLHVQIYKFVLFHT